MRHSFRRFSVVLFLATACATASAQSGRSEQEDQKSRKTAYPLCDLRKFKLTIMADGPSADGSTRLSYHSYKASDEIGLQTVFGDFDSPSTAEAELKYRAKFASKIIVNGWKLDSTGHVLGKRVEALLPGSKGVVFAVMWTSGRYFHQVGSHPNCKQAVFAVEKNIHETN